jgi:site-specific DNA-methyltransferase (adenine-specific)
VLVDDRVALLHGDSYRLLDLLGPSSVDAVVCDPPYGLKFMGNGWDSDQGPAFDAEFWRRVLEALKPGGHLLAFCGTRTYHRMAVAIEDAGFEIRDSLHWHYGSGFPKSMNVSKAIGRATDADPVELPHPTNACPGGSWCHCDERSERAQSGATKHPPHFDWPPGSEAAAWEGWGTALKPAHEPIVLARKPLDGTVAASVLAHGTGALNVDGCRVGNDGGTRTPEGGRPNYKNNVYGRGMGGAAPVPAGQGRWPANVIFSHADECQVIAEVDNPGPGEDLRSPTGHRENDRGGEWGLKQGSIAGCVVPPGRRAIYACVPWCPVRELDRQSGKTKGGGKRPGGFAETGQPNGDGRPCAREYPDYGGASRFFYCPKPNRKERDAGLEHLAAATGGEMTDRKDGSKGLENPRAGAGRKGGALNRHPTCKPIALMRWLCRLVTPPDGVVLDPFAGSGTTGIAAVAEGFKFVGVEMTDEYLPYLVGRIENALKENK